MELFTTIYSFMAFKLNLHGAAKEVFAVIFGFWKTKNGPVTVTNSVIRSITGLSHAAIVKAKNYLVSRKLIIVHEVRGKPSVYEVVHPEDVPIPWTRLQDGLRSSTNETSPKSTPEKVNKYKVKKDKNSKVNNYGNHSRAIDVGSKDEFKCPDQI